MIIKNFFRWFYCLPIQDVVLLMILTTIVFLAIRGIFGKHFWWKGTMVVLFVGCMGVIFYVTVINREPSEISQNSLILFHSYREVMNGGNSEIIRSNFMNVLLFYPAGLLVVSLLPDKCPCLLRVLLVFIVFAAVSIGIEYIQHVYELGSVEVDDVFHNTFGALLGSIIGIVNFVPHVKYK